MAPLSQKLYSQQPSLQALARHTLNAFEDLSTVPGTGLGYPTTDVIETTLAPITQISHFERGAIYWKSNTGARIVSGAIFDLYKKMGETTGVLGCPIADSTYNGFYEFIDFENGGLYRTGDSAFWPRASIENTRPPAYVLDKVRQQIGKAVDDYVTFLREGPQLRIVCRLTE